MMNRRIFAVSGLATIAFAGLACTAATPGYRNEVPGYGPLNDDPGRLLDLPEGFRYRTVSQVGEMMDDGFFVPDSFDGMGCFPIDSRRVALVRNHELKPGEAKLGATGGRPDLVERLRKAPHFGTDPSGVPMAGGTSTIIYDIAAGRRERQFLSLAGTAVNCAGGVTPWGSWLSCEETNLRPGQEAAGTHGWVFEVPASARGLVDPVPLKALGRFRHEAAAVDPATGVVYLTEDREDSLFYRFVPVQPGRLREGGQLQALALREGGGDTRNWEGTGIRPGSWAQADWIDLEDVESPEDDLRTRGRQAGAALFARGEGIHAGRGEFYFTCTSGGAAKLGQVTRYVPSPREGQPDEKAQPGRLQLFVESEASEVMDFVDNITIAPWGHLIACEDRGGDNSTNYLRGITPEGRCYALARLRMDTEFAGACFSPDGSTLFVNFYAPGKTVAITGPWKSFGQVRG